MKTSAITLGDKDVPAIMGFYGVYLLSWAWLLAGPSRSAWFWLIWSMALSQVVWHYFLIRHRSREGCFTAFKQNHWLGFCMFVGVLVAYS